MEAAFVIAFILAPLTFGAMETSFFVSHANALSDASRAAARVGVASMDVQTDDYYTLRTISNDADLVKRGPITKVIIFKADSPDGGVPAGCETGDVNGVCNHYTAADLVGMTEPYIDSLQTPWAPADRDPDAAGNMPYLGVKIEAQHNWITGWIPFGPTLSSTQIMRIEPTSERANTYVTPNASYTPYVYTP